MAERYKKLKTIGKGGFATVYLVKDGANDNEQLVLKAMDISSMGKTEQDMAKKEVEILASLCHPHIIGYNDNFVHRGKLNIVMEYASGGDLWQRIQKQGSRLFPETQIRTWFYQVLSALDYLHSQKMIHRDLKPQNVFLTSSGDCKIGDFGISKVMQTQALCHTQIGTPFYISPEICQNKPYDNKSDIWALGCLVHELCTLKPPFMADNMKAMMKKICYSRPSPISPSFSTALTSVTTSMLNKEPKKRMSTRRLLKQPIFTDFSAAAASSKPENSSAAAAEEDHQLDPGMAVRHEAASKIQNVWILTRKPSYRVNHRLRQPRPEPVAPPAPPAAPPEAGYQQPWVSSPARGRRHSFDNAFGAKRDLRGVRPVARSASPDRPPPVEQCVGSSQEPKQSQQEHEFRLPKLPRPPRLQNSESEHHGLHPGGRTNRNPIMHEAQCKYKLPTPAQRLLPYLQNVQPSRGERQQRRRRSSI